LLLLGIVKLYFFDKLGIIKLFCIVSAYSLFSNYFVSNFARELFSTCIFKLKDLFGGQDNIHEIIAILHQEP
jgi:hypothetical protein